MDDQSVVHAKRQAAVRARRIAPAMSDPENRTRVLLAAAELDAEADRLADALSELHSGLASRAAD